MARPKEFDQDAALDRAVELFWTRGYAGTSIAELERHLHVGRQSLYDTFGDKRTLFLRALERYSKWNADHLIVILRTPDSGLEAIRAFLQAVVELLTPPGPRKACLVANSILEIGQADAEISARCLRNQTAVTDGLRYALSRAAERGELPRDFSVEAGATLLMAQVYGLALLAKGGATRQDLIAAVTALVSRLGQPFP
jgi:TetR/AcrR family transcriptional repressor of nem operon